MNKKLESLSFNMTKEMARELIKYNNLKKEFNELKEQYDLTHNKQILIQLEKTENKLKKSRNSFIKKFQSSNQNEIAEYLRLKDQN